MCELFKSRRLEADECLKEFSKIRLYFKHFKVKSDETLSIGYLKKFLKKCKKK